LSLQLLQEDNLGQLADQVATVVVQGLGLLLLSLSLSLLLESSGDHGTACYEFHGLGLLEGVGDGGVVSSVVISGVERGLLRRNTIKKIISAFYIEVIGRRSIIGSDGGGIEISAGGGEKGLGLELLLLAIGDG
jgi:hypothetical protein